jgi:hypothetical protein
MINMSLAVWAVFVTEKVKKKRGLLFKPILHIELSSRCHEGSDGHGDSVPTERIIVLLVTWAVCFLRHEGYVH